VQELDEIERMRRYVFAFGSRFCSDEFASNMMSAAARWDDDTFEPMEEAYKMFFCRPAIFFAA